MKVKRFKNIDYNKVDSIIEFIEKYFDFFAPDISFDEHDDMRLVVHFFNSLLNKHTLNPIMVFFEKINTVKDLKWYFDFSKEFFEITLDSDKKIDSLLNEFKFLNDTNKYNL